MPWVGIELTTLRVLGVLEPLICCRLYGEQSRNLIIITPVIKDHYRGLARHFHVENARDVCNERNQFVRPEISIYHILFNGLPPKNGAFH